MEDDATCSECESHIAFTGPTASSTVTNTFVVAASAPWVVVARSWDFGAMPCLAFLLWRGRPLPLAMASGSRGVVCWHSGGEFGWQGEEWREEGRVERGVCVDWSVCVAKERARCGP